MRDLPHRRGLSLVEVLVVITVISILTGLLFVAVAKVRAAAALTQSKNNVKQIVLATHNFASVNNGCLPRLGVGPTNFVSNAPLEGNTAYPGADGPSLFVQILPYVSQTAGGNGIYQAFPLFLSPADPTSAAALGADIPTTSYAANAQVFFKNEPPRIAAAFEDGVSNTIAFAEHYSTNCDGVYFAYPENGRTSNHRPAFADFGDVVPVTTGNPPISSPSARPPIGVPTFQAAPSVAACQSQAPQTPHSSGMVVAMADGSVRQLSPSIETPVFWALVTPRAGDTPDGDW